MIMADHPNAVRVRELFAAFHGGDIETIRALVPEHAVWHFPGRRGQLAGTHRGRDAIFRFLLSVRVLTDKSVYNQIELPSGRMAQVKRGEQLFEGGEIEEKAAAPKALPFRHMRMRSSR